MLTTLWEAAYSVLEASTNISTEHKKSAWGQVNQKLLNFENGI